MPDSQPGGQQGKGIVDPAQMKRIVEAWGRMQPREQAQAIQNLTRGMSAKHREAIENYFRNLSNPPPEVRGPGGR